MKALIICSNSDLTAPLKAMLHNAGIAEITVSDGALVRKTAVKQDYDIILSVLPFAAEFGLDTCVYLSANIRCEQIIFVPEKKLDEVCSKTVGLDLTILPKNVQPSLAANIINRTVSVKRNMDAALRKNDELSRRIDENKLIYRAKCVLIEYLKISENEAHRFLQKRAMNKHITMYEAALEVLSTY